MRVNQKQLLRTLPGFVKGALVRNKVKLKNELSDQFIFKIATTREEREQAYKLAYDAYIKKGFIDPDPSGMHFGLHHAHPLTTTFIGKLDGEVVITMSLFPDSELGLPMDSLYQKELDKLRRRGRFLAEVGTLASSPKVRTGLQQLPMMMNNIMQRYASQHLGVDDLVITVNPAHKLIYKYMILFDRLGRNKPYDKVNGHVAVPMRLNLQRYEQQFYRKYCHKPMHKDFHYFLFTQQHSNIVLPEKKALAPGYTREEYHYFFEQQTDKGLSIHPTTRQQLYHLYHEHRVKTVPMGMELHAPIGLTKAEMGYLAAQRQASGLMTW